MGLMKKIIKMFLQFLKNLMTPRPEDLTYDEFVRLERKPTFPYHEYY